jgi:hypothetical protein
MVVIVKIFCLKISTKTSDFDLNHHQLLVQEKISKLWFQENCYFCQFFRRKSAKIAEVIDYNIGPQVVLDILKASSLVLFEGAVVAIIKVVNKLDTYKS